jgi:hypothetical protein
MFLSLSCLAVDKIGRNLATWIVQGEYSILLTLAPVTIIPSSIYLLSIINSMTLTLVDCVGAHGEYPRYMHATSPKAETHPVSDACPGSAHLKVQLSPYRHPLTLSGKARALDSGLLPELKKAAVLSANFEGPTWKVLLRSTGSNGSKVISGRGLYPILYW